MNFKFSSCVILLGGAAWPPPLGGVAFAPSLLFTAGWCCYPLFPLLPYAQKRIYVHEIRLFWRNTCREEKGSSCSTKKEAAPLQSREKRQHHPKGKRDGKHHHPKEGGNQHHSQWRRASSTAHREDEWREKAPPAQKRRGCSRLSILPSANAVFAPLFLWKFGSGAALVGPAVRHTLVWCAVFHLLGGADISSLISIRRRLKLSIQKLNKSFLRKKGIKSQKGKKEKKESFESIKSITKCKLYKIQNKVEKVEKVQKC